MAPVGTLNLIHRPANNGGGEPPPPNLLSPLLPDRDRAYNPFGPVRSWSKNQRTLHVGARVDPELDYGNTVVDMTHTRRYFG